MISQKQYSDTQLKRKIKNFNIIHEQKIYNFQLESIENADKIGDPLKSGYLTLVDNVISEVWGKFSQDFIVRHILSASRILLLWNQDCLVAFTTANNKVIGGKNVLYIEFTAVQKDYQHLGISRRINFLLIREKFFMNLFRGSSVEVIFISPNIRSIASLAKVADFIYPNPLEYKVSHGNIGIADYETWMMAQELISKSDNPQRHIDRNGNVLYDSYKDSPWLVYGYEDETHRGPIIPKHRNQLLNEFSEKYLKYSEMKGWEFIVRAKINIISFIKYYFNQLHAGNEPR